MAILDFQKPDKVIMLNATDYSGEFEFRPLEPGYGVTVGNAIRRILLNSLEGSAISSFLIEGVQHEFDTVKGVVEDVTDIVLNLKQVRFKKTIEDTDSEVINLTISGKNQFKAGDISMVTTSFEVLNPDHVICNMNPSVSMNITIEITTGRGYVASDVHRETMKDAPIGTIAIDSIFTPIKNVKYAVENFRVGQKTDYEKLVLEIDTDGSIHPKEALKEVAKILIHHFMLFSEERITLEGSNEGISEEFDETSLHMRQLLKTKLTNLDLSVRALNCLKAAEIDTLGDLASYKKMDLLKFRNFGKKSLAELEDLIKNNDMSFGMDISKYKLDK